MKMLLPIEPLMIEHRLIERMIALMGEELARLKDNIAGAAEFAFVDPIFIDTAVDFIRTYTDRFHHGKEEGILFAAVAGKDLTLQHRQAMEELIEDHRWCHRTIGPLLQAKDDYLLGKAGALDDLLLHLEALTIFYPLHIAKEDQHFFRQCMHYFSAAEKVQMLERIREFDSKVIHERYSRLVEALEHRKPARRVNNVKL